MKKSRDINKYGKETNIGDFYLIKKDSAFLKNLKPNFVF